MKPTINAKWTDVFDDSAVVMESDAVRKNTHDDYDLGPGWYFAGGRMIGGEWASLWMKLKPEIQDTVGPWLSEGIGGLEVIRWADDSWHVFIHSRVWIGSFQVDLDEAPPAALHHFFRFV